VLQQWPIAQKQLSIVAFYPADRQTAEALSAAVDEAQLD
jgi:hypothetical protein